MGSHDFIIVGLGTAGSAACMTLARRGYRVLGLDQHRPPHALGSHHGESRSVRRAYPEGSSYVAMAISSWDLWRALETQQRQRLLITTENITVGPPHCPALSGFLKSARSHDIAHEYLSAKEIRRRWPQFSPPDNFCAGLEVEAGIVFPESAIRAFLNEAEKAGAELHVNEPVAAWSEHPGAVRVQTSAGSYDAGRLLLAAGAWSPDLFGEREAPLTSKRVAVHWLDPSPAEHYSPPHFPVNFWQMPVDNEPAFPDGYREFYSLPALKPGGPVKVAFHNGLADDAPSSSSREVRASETASINEVVSTFLPGLVGCPATATTCFYTMTPDRDFYLGRLPGSQAVFGVALAGHGFKFAPVLGELLADLLTDMPTEFDITLFSPDRFKGLLSTTPKPHSGMC